MSYEERRLSKFADANIKKVSKTFTIPSGGGEAYATWSLSDLGFNSSIDLVVAIRIVRNAPIVDTVYAPSYAISADGTKVGLTMAAGAGTTLTAELAAYGL